MSTGTPCFSSWWHTQEPPTVFSHSSTSNCIPGVSADGLVKSGSGGTVGEEVVSGTVSESTLKREFLGQQMMNGIHTCDDDDRNFRSMAFACLGCGRMYGYQFTR